MVSPSSPHMLLEDFEKKAAALFREYFEHGDTQEVADTLEEFNIKNFKAEVRMCSSICTIPYKEALHSGSHK